MMVRPSVGALSLLVAFGLSQPLSAQTSQPYTWNPDRPDARAPMSVTEGQVLPEGVFQVGLRYLHTDMSGQGFGTDSLTVSQVLTLFDVAPSDFVAQGFSLDVMYGVTDQLTLSARGTFAQKTMDNLAGLDGQPNAYLFYQTSASGIEDVEVHALYDVLSTRDMRFHVQGGVSVPVGAIDNNDVTPFSDPRPQQLPYLQQLGSGTFDLLPGFTLNMQNEKASLGVQGRATIRLGENDRGWTLGDLYVGNLWAGLKTSNWVSVSLGVRYSNWGNVEGFDEALDPNESPANNTLTQAGWRVDLPIGLNFILPEGRFEGHRLGLELLVPLQQDLDGPQLRHSWSLAAGWTVDLSL